MQQTGADFQRRIAGYASHITHLQVARHPLDAMVKQAVGHGRIQHGGDDTSVQDAVIALQFRLGLKGSSDFPIRQRLESQS